MSKPANSRRAWAASDDALLRQHYPTGHTRSIAQALQRTVQAVCERAAKLGLSKARDAIAENTRRALQDPAHGSHRTRFGSHTPPWNKGLKGATGTHPNSRLNHFRHGSTNGRAAQLVLPLGTLRVNSDGMLQRKVATTPGSSHLRWHSVHRLVWEAEHGPVPPGHIAVFKPGRATTDVTQITADAVELVTRAEHMRRNSVHAKYPPELARLAQLRGVLARQINRKQRAQEAQTT